MGYLAINMSGQSMPVYSSTKATNQIGRIYHKERFSHLNTVSTDNGTASRIKFLNSSGQYVIGYCYPGSNQARDWINYASFSQVWGHKSFRTDAPVSIYNSNGSYYGSIPANAQIFPYSNSCTEIGASHSDWMRVAGAAIETNNQLCPKGMYVDCKISSNSTNTPVYGNWN